MKPEDHAKLECGSKQAGRLVAYALAGLALGVAVYVVATSILGVISGLFAAALLGRVGAGHT